MNKKTYGFTLIELLIVIALTAVIAGIGAASYFGQNEQTELNTMEERIAADIRATQNRAAAQENGQQWGVHFDSTIQGQNFYAIWYGPTYATGTTTSKVTFAATSLYFTNPAAGTSTDLIFTKPFGMPSTTSTTTITIANPQGSRTITVNANGTVSEQ
ncbi:MAG: prepilin-type N-terminal cleavage/methylation domain-containing protein [Patescibacteria group bacterium]|nr:prepilin-type N-terminal cleavage/methylation domain-containing protein [Patescibacteria group bacterium]MCL5224350.1 prepilin-type N-terminal cleavage/methylation domain-containing protein [Patescibacteria group bacterium]